MRLLQGENKENVNIVQIKECFEYKDSFVIIMELCDTNLWDYISKTNKKLDSEDIYYILNQLK